jgi:hypothetical protein
MHQFTVEATLIYSFNATLCRARNKQTPAMARVGRNA